MASPAATFSPREDRFFKCPNEFAENQGLFIPAERSLALLIFREARNTRNLTDWNGTARISDEQWIRCTGLKPRMMELAARGLEAKGLEISRPSKNKPAEFSWNWNKWQSAFRNPEPTSYDPGRKERDAKAAAKRVHPDCATGCAKLRELAQANKGGTNTVTPFLVPVVAQPVTRIIPAARQTTEQKWVLTLAAMRTLFASAGMDLLMKLLAVLVSFVNLSDYVLAEAVKEAYADSRGRWNSPILLLKTVPEVLKGWKAKGQPMDDPGDPDSYTYLSERAKEPPPEPPERPKKKRAVDLL
jgi:hypothetical protein